MGSKTNWAAVSALAAVGGVFVAFLAYAAPHPTPQPWPTPLVTTVPRQQPDPYTTTPMVAPVAPPVQAPTTTPGLPPTQAPLPIPGCSEAVSIVRTFDQTAGTAQYTRGSAARQAASDLERLLVTMGVGAAYSSITAVYNDFAQMADDYEYARGMDSDTIEAKTTADKQTLFRVCGN